jgi:hypothetical protein
MSTATGEDLNQVLNNRFDVSSIQSLSYRMIELSTIHLFQIYREPSCLNVLCDRAYSRSLDQSL